MGIEEREIQTINGWSLTTVIAKASEWGAPLEDISIEPVRIAPGLNAVPAMIWYERKSD